jgi:hypothetical protein
MQSHDYEILRKMIRETLNEGLLHDPCGSKAMNEFNSKHAAIAHNSLIDIGRIYKNYLLDLRALPIDFEGKK